MEGVEASAEDGSHQNGQNNPDNLYMELNDHSSELLRTVKGLKACNIPNFDLTLMGIIPIDYDVSLMFYFGIFSL